MITGYGIILEGDILYCSNENKYTAFEIVLFVEKLISSINPKLTWRLNNIFLKGYRMGKERLVVKHIITENNQNLFFAIGGDFKAKSKLARQMLDEFYNKVNEYYKHSDILKQASEKPIFKEIIEVTTDYLWDKYEDLLENEELVEKSQDTTNNRLLYCGISAQGLPIISQLYSRTLLDNLEREITEENVELYSSNLSAKLATIAMNTVIRAKTSIREIHIDDTNDPDNELLIFYGDINQFSLDFFAAGDFYNMKKIFKRLKDHVTKEEALQNDFTGDLKPYKHLHDCINKFYEKGI